MASPGLQLIRASSAIISALYYDCFRHKYRDALQKPTCQSQSRPTWHSFPLFPIELLNSNKVSKVSKKILERADIRIVITMSTLGGLDFWWMTSRLAGPITSLEMIRS